MRRRTILALATVLLPVALAAQTRTTLDVYVIDVEGGNATLFVAPSGESLLIDTGKPARRSRSAPVHELQAAAAAATASRPRCRTRTGSGTDAGR
jgi:hypothetical protein